MTVPFRSGRRRRHYVDSLVQKRLVIGIVALEVAMTAGALIFLIADFTAIIDERLYRIHAPDPHGTLPLLLRELLAVILALTAVNVVVLVVADRLWARHVDSVLSSFRRLLEKARSLDFSADSQPTGRHEALDRLLAWRDKERERCRQIRDIVGSLDPAADYADGDVRAVTRNALNRLSALLR